MNMTTRLRAAVVVSVALASVLVGTTAAVAVGPLAASNMSAAETYVQDAALVALVDMSITDAQASPVTVTWTFSDTAAGTLTTSSAGLVTSIWIAGTATWSASGPIADVNSVLAQVAYIPAAGYSSTFYINVSITDGISTLTGTKVMTGIPVNAAPVLDSSKSPTMTTIAEDAGSPMGSVGTLVSALVDFAVPSGQVDNVTDSNGGAQLGIAITAKDSTSCGTWYFTTGSGWTVFPSVSAGSALLLAADASTRVYCAPAADFNGSISSALTVRAWDRTSGSAGSTASTTSNGGTTAFSTATDTVALTVTSVQDAPTLDATKSPTLGTIAEDAGSPVGTVGTLVSSLVDFTVPVGQVDNVTDPDASPLVGIAITAANSSGCGTWYYTTGSGWTAFPTVADSTALLLSADASTRVYCSPAPNFAGTMSSALTIRAWDETAGTAGSTADTTSNGGTTAYSSATDAVALTVTGSQDAPTLDASKSPVLASEAEDAAAPVGTVGTLVSSLVDFAVPSGQVDNVTDPDASPQLGIAITDSSAAGCATWYYTTGGAWAAFPTVTEGAALLLAADASTRVFCVPTAEFSGTISAALTMRAWDLTSGSAGSTGDTTTNGGTTAFSAATDTVALTVTAVNDAPTLDSTKSPAMSAITEDAGAPSGDVGTLVSALVDLDAVAGGLDNISDPDPDAGAGLGIAISAADSTVCATWYYTTGSGWTAFPAVGDSTALLLEADASTRVYCAPAANANGALSSALTFRAWDLTSGTAGSTGDTTTNGGSSAFSSATDTVALTVSAVQDAPVLDSSKSPAFAPVAEDAAGVATTETTLVSDLVDFVLPAGQVDNVSDPDTGALLGIAVTGLNTTDCVAWSMSVGGGPFVVFGGVSEAAAMLLPADGTTRIRCAPRPDFTGTIASVMTFRAWDRTSGTAGSSGDTTVNGAGTAFSTATDTASMYVSPVNDAPVLDPSKAPVLNDVAQDATAPSGSVGSLVSSLVDLTPPSGGLDNVSDVDAGAELGIAITAADATVCSAWWFDTGSGWTAFPAVSDARALLLAADASSRVYCQPLPGWSGTVSEALTIRAWDRTAGSAGSTADTTVNGHVAAFSSATDAVALTVVPSNLAPVLDPSRTPQLPSVNQASGPPKGPVGALVRTIVDETAIAGGLDNVTDPDGPGPLGVAITATASRYGTAFFSLDNGASWAEIGVVSDSSALLLPADATTRVYFKPQPMVTGTIPNAVTFRAWDQMTGVAGQRVDATTNGGESAFSAQTDGIVQAVLPFAKTYGFIRDKSIDPHNRNRWDISGGRARLPKVANTMRIRRATIQ